MSEGLCLIYQKEDRALSRAYDDVRALMVKNTELCTEATIKFIMDEGFHAYNNLGILYKKKLARGYDLGMLTTSYHLSRR